MSVFTRIETGIIRDHRFDTTCYLLADHEECLALARGRVKEVTGRNLKLVTRHDLPDKLPSSWMLAVIHCPGDDVAALADWASKLTLADRDRILFYEPESYDRDAAARAVRPWMTAGLPAPVRQRIADSKELNRVLGNDLNWRILEDHRLAGRNE